MIYQFKLKDILHFKYLFPFSADILCIMTNYWRQKLLASVSLIHLKNINCLVWMCIPASDWSRCRRYLWYTAVLLTLESHLWSCFKQFKIIWAHGKLMDEKWSLTAAIRKLCQEFWTSFHLARSREKKTNIHWIFSSLLFCWIQ